MAADKHFWWSQSSWAYKFMTIENTGTSLNVNDPWLHEASWISYLTSHSRSTSYIYERQVNHAISWLLTLYYAPEFIIHAHDDESCTMGRADQVSTQYNLRNIVNSMHVKPPQVLDKQMILHNEVDKSDSNLKINCQKTLRDSTTIYGINTHL